MTQIIVTLEKDADTPLLRKMIENMRGVIETTVLNNPARHKNSKPWLEELHHLKNLIDPSVIDMEDERTRYIMSK